MDQSKDNKRRKEKQSDDEDYRRERRSKKRRSRSRSPRERHNNDSRRKRKHSRSKSPENSAKQEKRIDDAPKQDSTAPPRKARETDMLNTRTGGAYIPPARLRMMQAQITDKSSVAYQRLAWEALKKSIHGHINKINVGNIGIIIKELLKENIVRGRGLLSRSVIQAQAASPTFTNVYAALVSAVNSRFPNIGELLLKRLVIQFKRGFKRNDKPTCISSASFIAHLVNQRVAHEILALELLTLLVETPTDDSVEVAIAFLKECGQKLTEVSSKGVNAIFEMLRNILHEGQLDKRVQYMIEVMFQVWKDGFKDHPAVLEELELVPEEEQFTHLLMLDDATDAQDILNVFKFDDKYEENEQKYKDLSKEILGSDAESGDEDGSYESGSEESADEEEEKEKEVTIIDNTETNLVALRRTIYLTINSSLDFEECAHKLMKMQLKPGQEIELCHMFLDCCAEQRTYEKFYGLLAQRFCNINRIYIGPFEEIFKDSYSTAHRLDTNRLRNVSKFFAHLLFTDSISWEVLECVKLNEEDTTSSSRIYIKILFQELAEYMGLKKLNDRLKDPTLQQAFSGVFPRDNPKNTRFSINFFTSIGLGGLTDELREHLKQMPKNVPPTITEIKLDSESSSDSSSSSGSSSDSSSSSDSGSSDSEEENGKKKKEKRKKGKNKTKTPEPGENPKKDTERWGHDGFYESYGSNATRMESSRGESDKNRHNDTSKDSYNRKNGHDNFDNNRRRDDRRDRDREEIRRNPEDYQRYTKNRDDNKNYENEDRSRKRIVQEYERNKNYDREENTRRDRNHDEESDRRRNKYNGEDNDRRSNRNYDDNERRSNRNIGEDRRNNRNYNDSEDRRKDKRDGDDRDQRSNRNYKENDDRRKNNINEDRNRRNDKNDEENDDRRKNKKDDKDRNNRNYDESNEKRKNRNNDEEEGKSNKRNYEENDDRRNKNDNENRERRSDRNYDDEKDRRNKKYDYDSKSNRVNEDERKNNKNDEGSSIRIYNKESRQYKNDRSNHDQNNSRTDDNDRRRSRDRNEQLLNPKKNKGTDKHVNRYENNKETNKSESNSSDDDDRDKKVSKKNISKSTKSKQRKNKQKKDDTSSSSSESDSESDSDTDSEHDEEAVKNDLGGRYWDNFDIKTTREVRREHIKEMSLKKSETNREKRRKR